ncbi:MAG: glycosyltransferase family 2 protein, partial [Acidiferrobacterales bacterium]
MDSGPLVSAIIIFFNAEKYLEEAIESVFAQTYSNWELLLCDDGSTDGSTEIARRYEECYPNKVRYLEHEGHQNRGMSATRNLGIKHSKGEYIAWLDADDVWLQQKLQRQVEIISEHPEAAMVYGPYENWYSWTGRNEDYDRDFIEDLGVPHDMLLEPPQLLICFLQDDTYIPAIGVLVRRTLLEKVGGFEESLGGEYEDPIVHAKICLRWPVFASGECWYRYRQHEESYCAVITR